ncbi:uncharacterized protein LOC131853328 isoform X2 [Achroia grisella]|uniref:uncharacterized protein LOC131853328 isoform X2 n=1 Tax=Achroia grisella TaxID=688607 RepID=UPI0027D20B27|nr:uncharacterized protein LOC131853328 isoform X2 [Achroia grisella]
MKSMMINIPLAVLATALLCQSKTEAATTAVKFCGRQLGEIMSRVCHAYNSPSWDVPTVVEQTGAVVRRKRQLGIADECCTIGCTWEQLSKYCSISAYSESPLDDLEAHMIADRSAEQDGPSAPAMLGTDSTASSSTGSARTGRAGSARREVGRARSRGYGRARARGRRCWCRRKRRSGRRRSTLMAPRKKCSPRCARGRHRVAPSNMGPDSKH